MNKKFSLKKVTLRDLDDDATKATGGGTQGQAGCAYCYAIGPGCGVAKVKWRSATRFYGAKDIGRSAAFILTVPACLPARFRLCGGSDFGVRRNGFLVQANDGLSGIQRASVGLQ
jgi:hypothetical protein